MTADEDWLTNSVRVTRLENQTYLGKSTRRAKYTRCVTL